MFILYDLVFIIFMLVSLPVYLFKGKFHRGFIRRFGGIPKGVTFDRPIWIHAVSVGEAVVMRGLIEELRVLFSLKSFIISTVTPTGNKIARSIARDSDFVTYLPLDLSFITKRVIEKTKPCIFIIAETEIWPNLINTLYNYKIPVAILNARISDGSFKGYALIRCLIRPTLNKVNLFCAQSRNDSSRLKSLGVMPGRIEVTGNMKFDQVLKLKDDSRIYRDKLAFEEGEILLVAGSTHPKEEEVLLNIYRKLLNLFPRLRLLLAPRHPERADKVAGLVKHSGFNPQKVSFFNVKEMGRKTVFILDTVGDLAKFYAAADIVFVGGSLIRKGGHNILEPAFLGKPVIFGQYMFNFRDIAQEFLINRAALQVFNPEDLASRIKELLDDSAKVKELVTNAREVISDNQGATKRNLALIRKLIV
ncbi:MAG: 3-deoxy-D-manno-octulosonic acid transferase [Candidatus Omnitrophica bacterium]|nr:3-deoxy-D-manno-octulosonic acid transferase [Candidatus Omnitrophota bacterium]